MNLTKCYFKHQFILQEHMTALINRNGFSSFCALNSDGYGVFSLTIIWAFHGTMMDPNCVKTKRMAMIRTNY